jgi:N-acetylmuramoyl-L-alanine amidase
VKASEKYQITQIYLDGVPKKPFADGVGKPRGVCAHATANYGGPIDEDTATAERNWEQSHWGDAFVHNFSDYNMTLDIADGDYLSYGCGGGNPYYANFELCQTKDAARFADSYDRWVWRMAKYLYTYKLGVKDGVTLVSHRWVSQNYGGSHVDPHEYIESHGKCWADVVADVTNYYAQFIAEEIKPMATEQWKIDVIYKAQTAGLIKDWHEPDAPAAKWFVLQVALNLLDQVKKP